MSIFMSIYMLIYIRIIYAIYLRLILEKFSEIVENSKSFIYYVYNSPFCQVGLTLFLFLLLQVILRITFFLLLFFCFFCCYLFLKQSFCETLHGRHNLQKKTTTDSYPPPLSFWACVCVFDVNIPASPPSRLRTNALSPPLRTRTAIAPI